MLRLQDIAGLTLITSCLLLPVTIARTQTSIKTISVPSLEYSALDLVVDEESFSNPGLVFAKCTDMFEKKHYCTFILETKNPVESNDHLKMCNITQRSEDNWYIGELKKITAFGEDKAILNWKNADYSEGYAILHFSTCKYYVVKSEFVIKYGILVVADDIFSIAWRNTKFNGQTSCKNGRLCKITLDDRANIITGLISWDNPELDEGLYEIIYSPLKENIIVQSYDFQVKVASVTDGKLQEIEAFDTTYRVSTIETSKSHNLLTLCYPLETREVHCAQFGSNGTFIFETTIRISTISFAVFNLPGGGFFLVDNDCSIDDVHRCRSDFQGCFKVRKINADGKLLGCRKSTCEMQYTYMMELKRLHFYAYENGTYRVSYPMVIYGDHDDNSLNLNTVSFDDKDLRNWGSFC